MTLHVNLEQLLQHREFLTILARALVSDPSEQEELVWETMGEGATSPSDLQEVGPSALRAWLARVMRNRASNRMRAKQRRSKLERAGARTEQVESAADVAGRFELGQQLALHVQSLEPHYRDVVLLRFYDNLPPREIAKRLAVPLETVKTRLRRALVTLRERLDQEHGSRDKWLGSLVPLAFPSAKAAGVGITTIGVLLMMTKTKVALAVAVALLSFGAWTFWPDQEGDVPTILDAPDPALAQVQSDGPPVDHGSPGSDSQRILIPAEDRPQGETRSTVQVKVIDSRTGTAIPGVQVWAMGDDASLQDSRTDEDGTCSFKNTRSGLLLEASAKGYIIARSMLSSTVSNRVVRLEPGSSVRVHVRGIKDKVGKRAIRLVLIPRASTGVMGKFYSMGMMGQGGSLSLYRRYLDTMDELQAARTATASPKMRLKWMKAWGPDVATESEAQNPFAVDDRRFMSLGRKALIRTLGSDGRAAWEGLPPGKAYRIGMLSGARILFPAATPASPKQKPKLSFLNLPPGPPVGTNLSRAFDLDPGETKEIFADFLSPESQLRFTMPREFLPKGSKCIVTVHSIVASPAGSKTVSMSLVDRFECAIGTNQRSLDLAGPVYVKFHWKLTAYRHRFRSYRAHLRRGEEFDMGSVAWLDGGRSSRLRWIPSYGEVDLRPLDLSPLPRLRIQGTLYLGHAKLDREAMNDMQNRFSFNESIPLGEDLVFEKLDEAWITAFGDLKEDQKALLIRGVAKKFGIDEMKIANPGKSSLNESIEPNGVLVLKTTMSSSFGTEVRIPALTNLSGTLGGVLVGKAVRGCVLKVAVNSDSSGTSVVIRGAWSGSSTLWLQRWEDGSGMQVWKVQQVRAGVKQIAVAHEAKQIRVRIRVVWKKKLAGALLSGAYSNYAGSGVPGQPIWGNRVTFLDKNGEGAVLLPLGSTWSFRFNALPLLSQKGSPAVKEFKVTEGMGLIELQRAPK